MRFSNILKQRKVVSWKKTALAIFLIVAAIAIYYLEPYINQFLFPRQWAEYLNKEVPQ